MGRRPKWQIFRKKKGQKVDYRNDKIGALWLETNEYGNYFTGRIGEDNVVVYLNKYYNESEDGPDAEQQPRQQQSEYPPTQDHAEQTPPDDDDLPF
jgi:hypothetical protein